MASGIRFVLGGSRTVWRGPAQEEWLLVPSLTFVESVRVDERKCGMSLGYHGRQQGVACLQQRHLGLLRR